MIYGFLVAIVCFSVSAVDAYYIYMGNATFMTFMTFMTFFVCFYWGVCSAVLAFKRE